MRTGCSSRDDVRRRLRCATPNCSGLGTQRADACGHHFCDRCASSPQSHCSECRTPVYPTSPPLRSLLEQVGRLIAEGRCAYCVSVFNEYMHSLKFEAVVVTEAPQDLTTLSSVGFPSEVCTRFQDCDRCYNAQTLAMLWLKPSVMLDQGTKWLPSPNTDAPPATPDATHFAFLSRPTSRDTERGPEPDVVGGNVLPPPALVHSAAATLSPLDRPAIAAAAAGANPSSGVYSGQMMFNSPPSHGTTPPGSSRAAVASMALERSPSASSIDSPRP